MTKFDISSIIEESKSLSKEIQELKNAYKNKMQEQFRSIFDKFHEKWNGKYHSIYWAQYTPYFNDGEACEFSVHEFCISFDEEYHEDLFPYESQEYSFSKSNIDSYRKHLAIWEEYNKDPEAYTRKKLTEEFELNRTYSARRYASAEDYIREKSSTWKPSYYEYEELLEKISKYENASEETMELLGDWRALKSFLESIDDEIFESMFGDHVTVEYNEGKFFINDYDHE